MRWTRLEPAGWGQGLIPGGLPQGFQLRISHLLAVALGPAPRSRLSLSASGGSGPLPSVPGGYVKAGGLPE